MTPLYPHMTYLAEPEIGALIAPLLAALILAAVMVFMGHYRGYRVMELVRFRAMTEEGDR